jgi:membrane AbrB-like protein
VARSGRAGSRGRALGGSARLGAALAIGTLGGGLFAGLGLPLPWLLGALGATTVASLLGAPLAVPNRLRHGMIALLGVMLGGAFTLERLVGATAWLPSLAALPFYVVTVGILIFLYLRRMSDFDRASAFFAATPGGMSEMIALSDQLGGDQRKVSLVHGTRLLFIVFSIPFLARAFGSDPAAAPRSLAVGEIDPAALALLGVAGLLGYLFARRVQLPAATFVGPLLGSMVVHLAGWIATEPPYLLLALAQLVIGSSVGARFSGTPLGLVLRALALGAGATLLMLAITFAFGGVLHGLTGQPLALLLLAFIPGGFAEMSLIALGMGVDPAFVVSHHSLRVFLVVLIALPLFAWLRRQGWMANAVEPAD